MEKYPFQLRELSKGDGGGYMITFPDLPGCMSDGDTADEAIKNGDKAVTEWIAARKKWGKEIPVPTPPIDHIDFSGKFIQRVPKSVHAQLVKRAEKEGISMNQLVTSYIVAGLTSTTWKTASEPDSLESTMDAVKKSFARMADIEESFAQVKKGAFVYKGGGKYFQTRITNENSEKEEALLQNIIGAPEDPILQILLATYEEILKRNDPSNAWFYTPSHTALPPKKGE